MMARHSLARAVWLCLPSLLACGGDPATDTPFPDAPPILVDPADRGLPEDLVSLQESWFGDFDAMAERRVVRLLTTYRLGGYFLDGPRERGTTYEAARAFENRINKALGKRHLRVHVVILPVHRDELLPALVQGYGDIVAANLTITPERQRHVDFSDPLMENVQELVVTGPAAPPLATLEDLARTAVAVRWSSSYRASLEKLNARLVAEGRETIELRPAPESLEDADLLEMVDAGLLPLAVVDSHKARFWARVFDRLVVREDLVLRAGGRIAWAFRKGSPELAAVVNDFVRTHREGTLFGNVVLQRYLERTDWVDRALNGAAQTRFESMIELFEKYGARYGFDPLLVAAQAYQESGLDQSKRSRRGAVGVMQLLPATARDRNVDIEDIDRLENNIHAGVKYLDFIRSRYFDDPTISDLDRTLLSLAAYNAGPARVRKLRRKAKKMGLDPDVWFDNVEIAAARVIGRETVQYVSNIYKYYTAYQLSLEREKERHRARDAVAS